MIGFIVSARASSDSSLFSVRTLLMLSLNFCPALLLAAGVKALKSLPVLLLASRLRKVYPRKSNVSCSCRPVYLSLLQYTIRLFSGCISNLQDSILSVRAFRIFSASSCVRQWHIPSSAYLTHGFCGNSRSIHRSNA